MTERVGGAFALPQEHLLAARGKQEAVARVEPLPLGRYLYSPPGERVRQAPHVVQRVFLCGRVIIIFILFLFFGLFFSREEKKKNPIYCYGMLAGDKATSYC